MSSVLEKACQVRLLPVLAALLVALVAGATAASGSGPTAASGAIQVLFLFDLGDGTYAWSNATIRAPGAPNATWDATRTAAARASLTLDWAWSASYGVFITDVGNRSPPGGVGLYLWNTTTGRWDSLTVGISGLVLRDGDALAVSDNGFDPVTYVSLYPVPTPPHPDPVQQFRGDLANSGSSPSLAPRDFGVRWDRDLKLREIPSTPAIAYGRVYILTLDGLFALDESNGTMVWSNPAIRGLSTPAVFNGTLVLGGSDGRLHSVDAASGAERWNVTLISNPVFSGITSSPKIFFDTVYVGTFNETGGPGDVVALWATNGTIRWRHAAPGSVSFSSPAIADGVLFIGVIGRYNTTTQITYDPPFGILALDAATGAPVWFHPTSAPVAASPLLHAGEVIAPAKDGILYALAVATGSVLWQANVSAGVSSPALAGNEVIVGGGSFGLGGRVTALDADTGSVLWTFVPNGPVQSSVSVADGMAFFATNVANGTVYAVDAKSGASVWSYTPSPAQYIFGSPVVADGYVFAPSDNGHVYAFHEASPHSVPQLPVVPVILAVLAVVVVALMAVWVTRRRRHAP